MFSGLSKLADKAFVLGFYLPALIGVVAFVIANHDIHLFAEWLKQALSEGENENKFADIAAILVTVWLFAVLLMALNDLCYRILEGYFWPLNRSASLKKAQQQAKAARAKWRAAQKSWRDARTKLDEAKESGIEMEIKAARKTERRLSDEANEAQSQYASRYPADQDNILPTKLGNTIRAFETYSETVYGLSGVLGWPRLLAVLPKDYAAIICEARSSVDLFISLIIVATITGLSTFGRLVTSIIQCTICHTSSLPDCLLSCHNIWLFGASVVALVVVWLAYLGAIYATSWWGETVKSAFDIFRFQLAKKLGYVLPSTSAEEATFWRLWTHQFTYRTPQNFTRYTRTTPTGTNVHHDDDDEDEDPELLGG